MKSLISELGSGSLRPTLLISQPTEVLESAKLTGKYGFGDDECRDREQPSESAAVRRDAVQLSRQQNAIQSNVNRLPADDSKDAKTSEQMFVENTAQNQFVANEKLR